jgi:hypothetical protein
LESLLVDETIRLLDPGNVANELHIPQPKTEEELAELIYEYLGVRIPNVVVCPDHSTPWRALCDAYFATHPWSVWLGARGLAGKTYLAAVLGWVTSVTKKVSTSIIGGSGDQSEKVHQYMKGFWLRPTVPQSLLLTDPSAKVTNLRWIAPDGTQVQIKAMNASQKAARSGHPSLLICDEADELDWNVFVSVRGQPQTQGDVQEHMVVSSTMQYPDGTMAKALREAEEVGMPIHRWCYKESMQPHGWLSAQAVARKKAIMTVESWRVEVELGEPSPEGRAVDTDAVEAMFGGPKAALTVDQPWQMLRFEEPVPGAVYAIGCDWAQEIDYTVMWVWRCDVRPVRCVAYLRGNKRPYPWMIEQLMELIRAYPGEAFHDELGVGKVAKDSFTEPVEPYHMVGMDRNDLWLDYITAIERGECAATKISSAYHAHKYCRNVDLFASRRDVELSDNAKLGGKKPHPPDPFVAAALGWQAVLQAINPLGIVGGGPKKQAPSSSGGAAAQPVGGSPLSGILGRGRS